MPFQGCSADFAAADFVSGLRRYPSTKEFSRREEVCSISSRESCGLEASLAELLCMFCNAAARRGARSGSSQRARRELDFLASPASVPRRKTEAPWFGWFPECRTEPGRNCAAAYVYDGLVAAAGVAVGAERSLGVDR